MEVELERLLVTERHHGNSNQFSDQVGSGRTDGN